MTRIAARRLNHPATSSVGSSSKTELAGAVQAAVGPAHVSVWIRPGEDALAAVPVGLAGQPAQLDELQPERQDAVERTEQGGLIKIADQDGIRPMRFHEELAERFAADLPDTTGDRDLVAMRAHCPSGRAELAAPNFTSRSSRDYPVCGHLCHPSADIHVRRLPASAPS